MPIDPVLIVAGTHTPAIPLSDDVGSSGGVEFWHNGPMAVNVGITLAVTTTFICALGLSQPPASVWLTQYGTVPGDAVDGVGAVEDPDPPVDVVYHNKFVPLAVSGLAGAPTQ